MFYGCKGLCCTISANVFILSIWHNVCLYFYDCFSNAWIEGIALHAILCVQDIQSLKRTVKRMIRERPGVCNTPSVHGVGTNSRSHLQDQIYVPSHMDEILSTVQYSHVLSIEDPHWNIIWANYCRTRHPCPFKNILIKRLIQSGGLSPPLTNTFKLQHGYMGHGYHDSIFNTLTINRGKHAHGLPTSGVKPIAIQSWVLCVTSYAKAVLKYKNMFVKNKCPGCNKVHLKKKYCCLTFWPRPPSVNVSKVWETLRSTNLHSLQSKFWLLYCHLNSRYCILCKWDWITYKQTDRRSIH